MTFTRIGWIRIILLFFLVVFILRLGWLQLFQGDQLRRDSERNYYRWVSLPAPRGIIYDRKGKSLAYNIQSNAVWLVSGQVPRSKNKKEWHSLISNLTRIGIFPDEKSALNELSEYIQHPNFQPIRLKNDLTIEEVTKLEEEMPYLPGIYVKQESVRRYTGGSSAAHLLGYLREINAEELATRRDKGYHLKDRIGKSGVEAEYEESLRGKDGRDEVVVDALGRPLEEFKAIKYVEGTTLTLTIDSKVQKAAEAGLKGKRGAAVAINPQTGEILALVSSPSYDLNVMSKRVSPEYYRWMTKSGAQLNRATAGLYPPGSVFKIITAAASIENGKVNPGTSYYCDGQYYGIHCWKHEGHGILNLNQAIAESCNVYFMHLAEKVQGKNLTNMARKFGLGEDIDLKNIMPTSRGMIPTFETMTDRERRRWPLGNTLQMGIGQSVLTVTPLQSVRVVAAIANGGRLVTPYLVKSIGDKDEKITKSTDIGLTPRTIQIIATGLKQVTSTGTGKSMDSTLKIAGKTGTAQNRGDDHAWFAGYAPYDNPNIAVAVIIENGGHGGTIAAPIAQEMIRAYK
jgi:penicillin-binding protein 2